ncbi:hypothetical protein IWQ54_002475 [Labrenzia sp. EL_195]|nr:hypothetical protein [Labrenzia sp. EL_195]
MTRPNEVDQDLVDRFLASQPCAQDFHFPFSVLTELGESGALLYGLVRIESYYGWDGGGGRTDLHDIFGLTWAASLRASGAASSEVWIDVGWAGSPEINNRFFFFKQPFSSALSESELGIQRARLMAHTAWAAHGLLEAFQFTSPSNKRPTWTDKRKPNWLDRLNDLIPKLDDGIWISRRNPNWEYYVDPTNAVSIARLSKNARLELNHLFGLYRPTAQLIGSNFIVAANGLRNLIPKTSVDFAIDIIRRVEGRSAPKWTGAGACADENSILSIPLESHCIFLGRRTMIGLAVPCGLEEFDAARAAWATRNAAENALFNIGKTYRWAEKPNPSRFEELVHAILEDEPGLQWVRATGPTNERDQGRDMVVVWLTPPGIGPHVLGKGDVAPARTRRIVVQVKSRGKSVGKTDVRDVRDTIERHGADGFLLVAFPGWSNDLFNYLEGLAEKGPWVNLWGPSQLEERLRRRPHVCKRFPDVVQETG